MLPVTECQDYLGCGRGPLYEGDQPEMTTREAIRRSVGELWARVDEHQRLLETALEGGPVELRTSVLVDCPHKRQMKEVLQEVIAVLEETRRAFKSKQLEALRKKLTGLLAEDA